MQTFVISAMKFKQNLNAKWETYELPIETASCFKINESNGNISEASHYSQTS